VTPDELRALADAAMPGLGVINSDGTTADEWLIDHAPDLARLCAEIAVILYEDGGLTLKSAWLAKLAELEVR
jgi:hypothetical protein